jgi:hypothetical protein
MWCACFGLQVVAVRKGAVFKAVVAILSTIDDVM